MKMKSFLSGAATVVALISATAHAETLKWTLVDAVFDDGGTASGSFNFNTSTLAYTAINITTTAGSTLGGFTFTVENPYTVPRNYGFGSLTSLSNDADGDPSLDINTTTSFDTPGTVSIGETVGMFVSSQGTCYMAGCQYYTPIRSLSGEVTSTVVAVPEPATWAMMLVGFGAIGVSARRRSRLAVSA